jgi:hypothetical protein
MRPELTAGVEGPEGAVRWQAKATRLVSTRPLEFRVAAEAGLEAKPG